MRKSTRRMVRRENIFKHSRNCTNSAMRIKPHSGRRYPYGTNIFITFLRALNAFTDVLASADV